ncbi:PA14 domain-containing protein [Fulvimarina sp. 2208YS6-2-32]|uniref:PA14 domain-containing protein n=1 Tax=Fulvimarina uroteuthidis TaxID=3098149 RepID=A0ABU5I324_9HYPH|nr:PA14 domain-containing protein [Fulvimarina sp. 2208YS6-2-32]MDY8109747.1 PA14 domain-containing protein [Fulvimarina sp. 2208YS6-2-32]
MADIISSTIDKEQITGAFALAVDARFDDLGAGNGQKIFDFNNGTNIDTIAFGQVGGSSDVEFVIVRSGVEHRLVAKGAIVEGELATWRVGIDPNGIMRIAKNQELLVESAKGDAVLPADVVRTNQLIGTSSDPADADLAGLVLNLKIANYGNVDELDPAYQGSPCATTGEVRCFCDTLAPQGEVIAGENSATRISTTDAEGDGEWSQVQSLGLIPLHAMVLPDGKVLSFGTNEDGTQTGQFIYSLYDPITGIDKILPNTTGVDLFCSNMSLDPTTGNVIILGGDSRGRGGPVNGGVNDVVIFDYTTQTIRNAESGDMQYDRWYGTSVTLQNGEIFIIGGSGGGDDIPEVYNAETGMRTLNNARIGVDYWYPKSFVRSDGKVIVMSKEGGVFAIETDGQGSSQRVGTVEFNMGINTPAIMYREDKIVILKEDGDLYTMDLNASWLGFTKVADLDGTRHDGGMVILPDGRVLIAGGARVDNQLNAADYSVDIWNPDTNEVVEVGGLQTARLYHSSFQMMPNGTVWVGGGGAPGPLTNTNVEFYAPSYFYDESGKLADRPEITDAPLNIDSASNFRITVDDTSDIARLTAQRNGAFTHSVNSDARFLELDFTVIDATTIEVTAPGSSMLNGSWMLFALDKAGVPSMGAMLGVDMAPVVRTAPILGKDAQRDVYGIDDDPIDGPFDLTVEARFDDVAGGSWQRVFDFAKGAASDNVYLSQVANTTDIEFAVFVGATPHKLVARNVIEEGVVAKWSVSVSDTGFMRLWKDDALVAEGQGAVPRDVDRGANLAGESNWPGTTPLKGMVRFLEIVNEGDQPEYVHLGLPKLSLTPAQHVLVSEDGEAGQMVFRVELDQAAPSVVTARITISGDATGPTQIVIPAGQRSAEIVLTVGGDAARGPMEKISVALSDLTQARAAGPLEASAFVFDETDAAAQPLKVDFFNAPGQAKSLADIDFEGVPIHSASVTSIDRLVGTKAFYEGGPTDLFAARYTGQFVVETAGTHTFHLSSDDGSCLFIDGKLVIDNDGLKPLTTRSATIDLSASTHTIEVRYFELRESAGLKLDWNGPGFGRSTTSFGADAAAPAFHRLGTSIYIEGTPGLTREQAEAEAKAMGGKLVEVGSAEENAFLRERFGGANEIWLGIDDVRTEGSWRNQDGTDATYLNFAPGEPNNYGNEDFVAMRSDGLWNDLDGTAGGRIRTIIELTAPEKPPVVANRDPIVDTGISVLAGSVAELADRADGETTAQLTATGTIAVSDADKDALTADVRALGETYLGAIRLDPVQDGSLRWTFTVADGELDALGAGESLVQRYAVTVSDGRGGQTVETVTVTLVGAEDRDGEVFRGSPGDDGLVGTDGDDRFERSTGRDVIDGGKGSDTVELDGRLEDYRVEILADGAVRLTDATAALPTVKTLRNIESVVFPQDRRTYAIEEVKALAKDDGPAVGTAPVAEDDSLWFSLSAGEAVTGETGFMLYNDSDPDGDPLQVISVDAYSARGAAVRLRDSDGDGVFDAIDYDPTVSLELAALGRGVQIGDTVGYTISDGKGGTDTATVHLTVDGIAEPGKEGDPVVNGVPTAGDDTLWFSLSAGEAVTGETAFMLSNDADPDGDRLQVTSIDAFSARGAAVRLRDSDGDGVFDAVDYDPTVSVELSALGQGLQIDDTVGYTISDGKGGTDTATVHLTIDGARGPIDPSAGSLDQIAFAQSDFSDAALAVPMVEDDGLGLDAAIPPDQAAA